MWCGLLAGPAATPSIQAKSRTPALLVLYPACPCYLLVGQRSGVTRVDAAVSVSASQRSGLRLVAELTRADGEQIQTATADASKGGIVGLELSVPVQAVGAFGINVRLVDAKGKELAKASTDVHVAPRDQSQVQIGPDGFLRVGGQRQFPIGMYSAGHFEEMGKAGFTATHNYTITTGEASEAINPTDAHLKQLLDNSWANGMRMMVELPRKAIEKAQWQQVRRRIETFRHHPGLLCWGSEERVARGVAPLTNVCRLYQLVHELDSDHPFVLGDTKDVIQKFKEDRRDFFPDPCMDIGIWWWYPIPLKEPDENGLDGREKTGGGLLKGPSWLTTTISKRPLWIAIQSYQHKTKDGRFPAPTEYRCMAYLSIINGVKGLWFYTGSGQKDYQGKPAGLLNKPVEGHWDYVRRLVGELREFSPVIMAPSCAAQMQMSPADAPVGFAVRELDGKVYLIAANKSGQPQSVRFSGTALKGRKVRLLYEAHQAEVRDTSLADTFIPFGVHVYRLE